MHISRMSARGAQGSGTDEYVLKDAEMAPPAADLRILFGKLRQFRWRIAIVTLLFALLGAIYVLRQPSTYTTSADLLIGELGSSGETEEIERLLAFDSQRMANAAEVIYSPLVLESVVERLLAGEDYAAVKVEDRLYGLKGAVERLLADVEVEDGLYGLKGVVERLLANVEVEDGPYVFVRTSEDHAPSSSGAAMSPEVADVRRQSLVDLLQSNLSVDAVSESSVLNVSYTSGDPVLASRIVNLVVSQYIDELRQARKTSTERRLAWLDERIVSLRTEIQEAERALELRRAELSVETGQGLEAIQRTLDARTDDLIDVQDKVARLEDLLRRLRPQLEAPQAGAALDTFRDAPEIAATLSSLRDLEDRLGRLEASESADPASREELQDKQREAIRQIGRITAGLERDIDAARAREEEIRGEIQDLRKNRILEMTGAETDLRQMEMDAEIRRQNYQDLSHQYLNTLGRAERASINVQVLSQADVPEFPDSGRHIAIVLLAAVTGFLGACGYLVLREVFTDTFRGADSLSRATGLPVFGRIPFQGGKDPAHVIEPFLVSPDGALAEGVRDVCVNLLHARNDEDPHVVLVASPEGDEGCSTLAFLSAIQFQRLGRKTLFVNCETGQKGLQALFHDWSTPESVTSEPGDVAELSSRIVVDARTGLSVLLLGAVVSEPGWLPDMLEGAVFRRFLDKATEDFDTIVINTRPVLQASDAKSLARRADMIIMAVRWGTTRHASVMRALAEFEMVGAAPAGSVLTMIDTKHAQAHDPSPSQPAGLRRA